MKTKRRTLFISLILAAGPTLAAGLGATDYGYLDAAKIDPNTGIATLLIVIDRPLEDGLTKPKVRNKILAYHQWVFVDQKLVKQFPKAQPERGVRLVILHPSAKNALGTSVLEQLVAYAKELRFEPVALPLSKAN